MLELATSLSFWIALSQIIAVNFALSGNNGMVIALAARSLPAERRKRAIFWGTVAAIAVRVLLTVIAFAILALPYMKIVGGMLLLSIAVQLLVPEAGQDPARSESGTAFDSPLYRIMLGNLAMGLDNVLGVAAAAADSASMLVIGLAVSIFIITSGSALVAAAMSRLPAIYPLCAGLIAYLAGNLLVGDIVIKDWVHGHLSWLRSVNFEHFGVSIPGLIGVAIVFPAARLWQFLSSQRREGAAAKGENESPGRSFLDYLRLVLAYLSSYRLLSLLPFAAVIAVTYLGHPLYLQFRHRLLPQVRYSGLALGMTQAEVIRVKGYPVQVLEEAGSGKRPAVRLADIPGKKTVNDYAEWEYLIGKSEPATLEVFYAGGTKLVTQISCYSRTSYCPPVAGISTGASRDEVLEKLGEPSVATTSNEFQTLDYPNLHLSLLLEGRRVVMLSVREFEAARAHATGAGNP